MVAADGIPVRTVCSLVPRPFPPPVFDDVIALAIYMAVRVFMWRTGLLLRSLRTPASKRGLTEARPEPEREEPSANDIASIAAKLVS